MEPAPAARKTGILGLLAERARSVLGISPLPDLLARAAMAGDLAEARRLLALGARDAPGHWRKTALVEAATRGDADMIEALLGAKACDPRWRDEDGMDAFAHAAEQRMAKEGDPGDPRCLRMLLPFHSPGRFDKWGRDALMGAAAKGRVACVAELLPVSDPLARSPENPARGGHSSWTLLEWAVASGSPACVAALLPHCDARAKDKAGFDPLMLAARRGMADIVEMLLPHSDLAAATRSPGPLDQKPWSALMLAATGEKPDSPAGGVAHGSLNCVKLLIQEATPDQAQAALGEASETTRDWIAGWIHAMADAEELAKSSPVTLDPPKTASARPRI